MYKEIVEVLTDKGILTNSGALTTRFRTILTKNPHVDELITSSTSFLPPDRDVRERIYCIMFNIVETPVCRCGQSLKFRTSGIYRSTYPTNCSPRCIADNPDVKLKRADTVGNSSVAEKNAANDKRKQTMLDVHGVENPMQLDTVSNKRRQTIVDRYGVENAALAPSVIAKRAQTNITRYGVENPLANDDVQDKVRTTMVERYGVANIRNNVEFMEDKREQSLGVKHALQSSDILERQQQSMLDKYGVKHALQVPEIHAAVVDKIRVWFSDSDNRIKHLQSVNTSLDDSQAATVVSASDDIEWLSSQHIVDDKTLTEIATELGITHSTVSRWFAKHSIDVQTISRSYQERQFCDYISEIYNGEMVTNTRKVIAPYELDLYLPELGIAFEYNGIYWHSELNGKNRNYHIKKTAACAKVGVRLIHVWDGEWLQQNELVRNRIKHILGKSQSVVYARKCKVVDVSSAESEVFLNTNHIQGHCIAKYRYGLEYNGELVALMTFSKSRYSNKYEYELIRYACSGSVVGGAGKLFKHFIRTLAPTSIVSYCDLRWNTGKVYESIGFDLSHAASPNYFYFKRGDTSTLYPRVRFQKHKLSALLEQFDPQQTEWQNMVNNGYDRIWDCGNNVYVWGG